MRTFFSMIVGLLCASAALAGDPPQAERKDAAQAVGEGNAARWLEYYRRERGQDWTPESPSQTAPKSDERATREPPVELPVAPANRR